jgi:hypothetical protein
MQQGGEPVTPVIAWHFVLNAVSINDARRLVDVAQKAGFNSVVVQITRGVALDSAPWAPGKNAWSKSDFLDWVGYARAHGMGVIPEIKLLTHQDKFFQNASPQLMFNAATYDPRNEKVYIEVFKFLDDLISILHPVAIHIGHDEVAGFRRYSAKKHLKPGQEMLPADLFLSDVIKIRDYLAERHTETWMWGDMLLSPEEFPSMSPKLLHGEVAGYGKALRDKLPRDIVICDWQYKSNGPNFPELATMVNEGFKVIGATFKNVDTIGEFSRYAAEHGALGMIATTWAHVQRKEWDVVDNILMVSGKTFNQDFKSEK